MTQFSVTVVIPVWNEWNHTKNCLETLRPTLGVNDEVVIVDNGSEDGTKAGLKHYPWVKVITNEENLGFAKACNQGASVATKDVVIFLNNDTLTPGKWIEGLVWPFEDATVVATGPRSNAVSGPQIVANADYALSPMSSFRQWARDWREAHRGQTSALNRLVGFCLAVRRSDFEAVGGFDEQFGIGSYEDDDLCRRLAERGQLLVCHESFVHHVGHATFDGNGLDWVEIETNNAQIYANKYNLVTAPGAAARGPLLSACMIIKDEIDNLDRCLTSLNGLVDEVIIYDTGSTDGSIELARAAGATVIEGHWDDDFGRARNEALAHCKGEWILHIDADEEFDGSAADWRATMERGNFPAYLTDILNLSDGGQRDVVHQAVRLFRRDTWMWSGRLHEQVVPLNGGIEPAIGSLGSGKLVHHGYLEAVMEAKDKGARNLRIAQLDAAESTSGNAMELATNVGRSLAMNLRYEEALTQYRYALTLPTTSERSERSLLRAATLAALAIGRPEEGLEWIAKLEVISNKTDTIRYLRGMAYGDMDRYDECITELAGLTELDDEDGMVFPLWQAYTRLANAYATKGKWKLAAETIALAAVESAHDEPIWTFVVDAHYKAGLDISDLMVRIPTKHLNAVFGQLVEAIPEAADAALEALMSVGAARVNVLALAIRISPLLSVSRALEWASRLRSVQMNQYCPLVAIARNPQRPALERVQAAATADAAFGEPEAPALLEEAAADLPVTTFPVALSDVHNLSADLLPALIVAAATTPERSAAMGKALFELGADDEGVAVALMSLEQGADSSLVEEIAQWLESVGHAAEAATVRLSR